MATGDSWGGCVMLSCGLRQFPSLEPELRAHCGVPTEWERKEGKRVRIEGSLWLCMHLTWPHEGAPEHGQE